MIPVVCIVGLSGSGKTTLLEKLIPELIRRGYRVAAVKHTAHRAAPDRLDSDTSRLGKAGSVSVALSGPGGLHVMLSGQEEVPLGAIAALFEGRCDILLTEGYKRSRFPRIEVLRGSSTKPVSPADELLAVVSDAPLDVSVPQYSPDDVVGLSSLIEQRIIRDA
jgi:molybdopterin-guanine dinucleotide biosynthesis protein MobB